jgi:general secretion pathway protein N
MRWWLILAAGVLVLGTGAAFLPLRFAVDRFVPELEADQVTGTIWNGQVRNASYRDIPVGDVDVALSLPALLRGRGELAFQRMTPNRLTGHVGGSTRSRHLRALTGELPVPLLPLPLPPALLRFEQLNVTLDAAGRCTAASGAVTAELPRIPGTEFIGSLGGTARCDGHAIHLPLAAGTAPIHLHLWAWTDGRWRAGLLLPSEDRLQRIALAALGFAAVDEGMMLTIEGRGREITAGVFGRTAPSRDEVRAAVAAVARKGVALAAPDAADRSQAAVRERGPAGGA